jgi:hypothetical protein
MRSLLRERFCKRAVFDFDWSAKSFYGIGSDLGKLCKLLHQFASDDAQIDYYALVVPLLLPAGDPARIIREKRKTLYAHAPSSATDGLSR